MIELVGVLLLSFKMNSFLVIMAKAANSQQALTYFVF